MLSGCLAVARAVESLSEVLQRLGGDRTIVSLYSLRSALPWKTPQRSLQPGLDSGK